MKARIRKTNEIINVVPIPTYNIDSSYELVYKGNDILYRADELDFINNENNIDWEQRRYEIAKTVIQGIWANYTLDDSFTKRAEWAVEQADALIAELKKK